MVQQLIIMLVLIGVSFFVGMLIQHYAPTRSEALRSLASQSSLLLIIPFAVINSLWQLSGVDTELLIVPLLGVGVIGSGAVTAIFISRIFSLSRIDFASLLPTTSFYNIGALGALFAFVFFGEDGVALLALFKLFEEAIYFGLIFPYCRAQGKTMGDTAHHFWRNPVFVVSVSALCTGLLLSVTDVRRPSILSDVSQWLIPLGSLLLVFAAGLTFHLTGSRKWARIAITASMTRIAFGVLFVLFAFWSLDLWSAASGVLLPLCIILACMPCGFIGVLPARLYGLNTAVANTCWIVTYFMSLVVGTFYFLVSWSG
ncbi:hypothetical protein AAFX24_12195 [Vibrio mediterranei]|uniref:AEC family transporter n=1 Tax=Vibrio mediterranei TaxID=689 RepID=UPI0038CE8789